MPSPYLVLSGAVALGALLPARAAAQAAVTTPTVTLSPAAGSSDGDSLAITIEWCSATPLDAASISMTLGGRDVTGRFADAVPARGGCAVTLARRGMVALTAGRNEFVATICDPVGGLCTSTSATYLRRS